MTQGDETGSLDARRASEARIRGLAETLRRAAGISRSHFALVLKEVAASLTRRDLEAIRALVSRIDSEYVRRLLADASDDEPA